jgi:Transposase DDE domain
LSPITETINVTFNQLENEQFICCQKDGKSSFSRYRLLTFKRLVVFILQQLQRSLTRELQDFVKTLQKEDSEIISISKAAFCKARLKLKHTVFTALNETFLKSHYQKAEKLWLWKGYRLIAGDGSTAEVPNSAKVKREWGIHQFRKDGKAICMSRFLTLYDVLNRLTLASEIDCYKTSESELLWRQLPNVVPLEDIKDVYIFDRLFASHLLIFYLHSRCSNFCFRMKDNWWKVCESFYNSGETSRIITLQLPKKDIAKATALGIVHQAIQVRLARVELDNGEVEILLTSLCDEENVTVVDLKELYNYRWPIETSYCRFKHKLEIENFSGKSIKAIKQDFHAKVLILNIAAAIANPIDDLLKKKCKVEYKHQVNFSNLLGELKTAVVDWIIHCSITQSIQKMVFYLLNTTEPIRKGRKFNRPKLPKKKFHMNYKRV